MVRSDVLVSRDKLVGYELAALKFAIVELVNHEGFETVGNRVDPVYPATPTQHIIHGDDEAGENY